jgi:hypothetical protein
MGKIALSLATVFGLGIAVVGGRGIAASRAAHTAETTAVEARVATPVLNGGTLPPIVVEGTGPTRRLWYGGILAPIVVEATAPAQLTGHAARDCPTGGR